MEINWRRNRAKAVKEKLVVAVVAVDWPPWRLSLEQGAKGEEHRVGFRVGEGQV